MASRDILVVPDPRLSRVSESIDAHFAAHSLARDLVDTMKNAPRCVGLAAPQIGENVRMIAVDVRDHPKTTTCHGLVVLVNPIIVRAKGSEIGREGCLSIPDLTADIARARSIVVEGINTSGEPQVVRTEGFEARALQHEIDHLNGILILDRVASSKDIHVRRRK